MRRRPGQASDKIGGEALSPGQFLGKVLVQRHYPGVHIVEASYGGDQGLPTHSHEAAFICLLLDGSYEEWYGRKRVGYQPYTAVFHPPGEEHRVRMSPKGGRVLNVELSADVLQKLLNCSSHLTTAPEPNGGKITTTALRLYREVGSDDPCAALAVEGLTLELLAAVGRCTPGGRTAPEWLGRVVDFIHDNFRGELKIDEIAAAAGVHPVHLATVFRKFKSQTVSQYQRSLRIQWACRQMAEKGPTLAELAVEAGFYDQSHFTRAFKEVIGVTPGRFRRSQ